jgi:hypothetical protein
MRVLNEHSRRLEASTEAVGELLDLLASKEDGLWPHEQWPPMRFDGPLAVGAKGGHGPIRYSIEEYEAGREIVFRFREPAGFNGTHRFSVRPVEGGCELRHLIEMTVSGPALFTWPLVFRPLHDALLEDALDKADSRLAGTEWVRRKWPWTVKALRRMLARGSRR